MFCPAGIPFQSSDLIRLYPDEFEAVRLCDYEGKNQIEAAAAMAVSRGTVQRLLKSGRRKITGALLNVQALELVSEIQ